MFGGFIENQGSLQKVLSKGEFTELHIAFSSPDFAQALKIGRSVAVNGTCLTIIAFTKKSLVVECSEETIRKTILSFLQTEDVLNLELPLTLTTFLDGHIVSGHIDTLGKLKSSLKTAGGREMTFEYDPIFSQNIVEKGSVAVNGVSLTVFHVTDKAFTVSVISHTFDNTNLRTLQANDHVNLEFDLIGKYVLNLGKNKSSGLTKETLLQHGFL